MIRPYIGLKTGTGPGGRGPVPSVEIKTGTRRLIEFFLSPLLKSVQETARERVAWPHFLPTCPMLSSVGRDLPLALSYARFICWFS